MTLLSIVLGAKIAVTGLLIAAPFLFLPAARLAAMFRTTGEGSATLFRLYGIAVLALLAGYASGFWTIAEGRFPWGVVVMGLISNGGAALALLLTGAWRRALPLTLFLVAIAAALAACAVFSRQVLAPL